MARRFFVFVILAAVLANSALGAEKRPIPVLWATEAFPPFYIMDGPHRGKGTADTLIGLLSANLPGYDHQRNFLPIFRIIQELKSGNNVICISFLKDPTLDSFAQYSVPVFIVPPQELIVRRETWEQDLRMAKSISLTDLLNRGDLMLGLSQGRSYGDALNSIVERMISRPGKRMYIRTGDHFVGLADMLKRKNIDMVIAYSGEKNFVSPGDSGPLVSIPIKENIKPLTVYAVLPRSPWGNRFVEEFNAAVTKVQKTPGFKRAILDWFTSTPELEAALAELAKATPDRRKP